MSLSLLKIRMYGDPSLRAKCAPLKKVGAGERMVMESMISAMYQAKGVGLAAPQVGIIERFFVLDIGDGPMVIVNPRITKKSGLESLEEGCLSIPEVTVAVSRPEKITVEYMDETSKAMRMTCDGLLARVVQHETDHLDGKLIVDYATDSEREHFQEQLQKLETEQKERS